MSEDVSATMRVGITVILVAALVATVLNLMVMSNSLLSGGQTTLQGGIDSVSQQEFAAYDNTKVSGTQVNTALSLFQNRDVAIIIQTTSLEGLGTDYKNKALNYGALVTADNKSSSSTNKPTLMEDPNPDDDTIPSGCNTSIITAISKRAYLVTFGDQAASGGTNPSVVRKAGEPYYTAYLHNTNGLVDSNYDIIGTTELGNAAYILSSARFSSVLIKDPTGSIVGIMFEQIQ